MLGGDDVDGGWWWCRQTLAPNPAIKPQRVAECSEIRAKMHRVGDGLVVALNRHGQQREGFHAKSSR